MPKMPKNPKMPKILKNAKNSKKIKLTKSPKKTKDSKNAKNFEELQKIQTRHTNKDGKKVKLTNIPKIRKMPTILKMPKLLKMSKSSEISSLARLHFKYLITLWFQLIFLNGMFSRIVASVIDWVGRHREFDMEFERQNSVTCVFVRTWKRNEIVMVAVALFDGLTAALAANWKLLALSFVLLEVERYSLHFQVVWTHWWKSLMSTSRAAAKNSLLTTPCPMFDSWNAVSLSQHRLCLGR